MKANWPASNFVVSVKNTCNMLEHVCNTKTDSDSDFLPLAINHVTNLGRKQTKNLKSRRSTCLTGWHHCSQGFIPLALTKNLQK